MAEAVVSFVVERIGLLLIEEATLLRGVSQQVKQLQIELNRMRCFLKDADRRQNEDDSVRNWVSEIRDIAYDAEDVIETFLLKFASEKSKPNFIIKGVELHSLGSKIEAIKTQISDITRSLQTYGINAAASRGEGSSLSSERQRQLRWSYSHVVEEYIVGLEGTTTALVAKLVDKEKDCPVLSICGMGGIGKTTLAKTIYHHNDIKIHFEGSAWAYISQQCQRRDVWKGILFKLTSPTREEREEIQHMGDEEIAKRLHQVLSRKKCLVILDDIWSTDAWDALSPAFPNGETSSKILLTTRNKEVALHINMHGFIHEPGCLNQEESWDLLQKKAFPMKDDPDFTISEDMERLGREMLERCGGLPLAIIVLGGLLATKETLPEWEMVHRNIKSYLGGRGKGHKQNSSLSEVLALSYHELPYQLKPCFLYLSQFPEDFNIPIKKVVRLLVAEGIVSSQHEMEEDETMEDVAEAYLEYLINRCMVQVGQRSSTGRIKTCRLHDLMRDLGLSKAKEENFLHTSNLWVSSSSTKSKPTTSGRIRRLSMFLDQNVGRFIPPEYEKNPHLRSLLFFHPAKCRLGSWESIKPLFHNFKLLKILDLEGIKGLEGELPEETGSLIQLTYLSLKKTRIRKLPLSIKNLVCLQTLDLQTVDKVSWESTVEVPDVIWNMESLRHLYLPKWCGNSSGKLQLATLKDLLTLVNFPANRCNAEELLQLTNLRKLVLNNPRHFEKFVDIFKSPNDCLSCLQSLSLRTDILSFPDTVVDVRKLLSGCPVLQKLHVEGRIENLPGYQQFPPHISKLTLWGSRLAEDPMKILEKLRNLRYLSLWEAFVGKKMVCSIRGFPCLKSLLLRGLPNLEEWIVEEGAMSSLSRLEISDCNKLKTIPEGLRHVRTLGTLEISWMPRAFKRKLGEEGEDFYKIQHVPSVLFLN